MPLDTALIDAILAPVAGDNSAGKDLRYDPRYDHVKEARREDMELPEGGLATERKLADWPQVVKLARKLLETETKDLQLAAWLSEGLLKTQGLGGLATGAEAVRGILEKFWETCYPAFDEEDPELRAGPLDWMGTKLEIPVRQSPIAPGISLLAHQVSRTVPTQAEADSNAEKRTARTRAVAEGKVVQEAVEKAIADEGKAWYKVLVADADSAFKAITALEKESDARFGNAAPSFGKVRGALDEIRRMAGAILAEKLIADPDPIEEVVVEEGAGVAPGEAATVMSIEPVSPADAANRVAVAARFLRKLDATNPAPYLMLRGLRWGELRAAAGQDLDPKLLEAPPTALRTRLRGLLLDGKWAELLEQSEVVMGTAQGRGWLDLQRYVLSACEQLGSAYDRVARAVRDELRLLLSTVPRLALMTLMDDVPTANPETLAWLVSEGLAGTRAQPAAGEGAMDLSALALRDALGEESETGEFGGLRAGPWKRGGRDPFQVARAEHAQGRPHKAIEILLGEVARERSPRGRFVRQTQAAYMMVEGGLDAIARPVLDKLVATIDERKLEDWESGPLVAQPLALIVKIMDRTPNAPAAERSNLYLRICRLDPLQAMALQKT